MTRLPLLQRISLSLMIAMIMVTFVGANLHALLWQGSEWLVSTVLPSVVVDLTNDERADEGAAPLRRNEVLDAAARLKAEHMAKNEYFAHFSPDGVSPWHWFDEAGYVYAHAGENLAIHFTDSDEVVEAWMNSPLHRANIVANKYTEIGVGTAKGTFEGFDTVYVVQLFGTPAVAPAPIPAVPEPVVAVESAPEAVPEVVILPETDTDSVASSTVLAEAAEVVEPIIPAPELVVEPEPVPLLPEEVLAAEPEPAEPVLVVAAQEMPVEEPVSPAPIAEEDDVVVIESSLIATSSGLVAAQITTPPPTNHAGATLGALATQPNKVLQIIYFMLASVVVTLLSLSIVLETRRFHYVQAVYGALLLIGMGGLWLMHAVLTTGAVIV